MKRALTMLALAAVLQTMTAQDAAAQAPPAPSGPGLATPVPPTPARRFDLVLRAPTSYRSWELEAAGSSATISQLHLPFTASMGMGTNADLVISGGMGFSSVEPDSGRTLSLDGATDVIAQAFVRGAGNRLLLQAGVNLPAGKRNLEADQFAVSRALGHPLLAFRLKQYGRGTDVTGGLSLALPLTSGLTFGAGTGVILRAAYPLVDGMADYEPSSETAISAGLDVERADGAGPSARLDVVYRLYGTDQQGGVDLMEPGDQTEIQLTARTGRIGRAGRTGRTGASGRLDPAHPARPGDFRGVTAEATARVVLKADDLYLTGMTLGEPQATRPGTYSRFTAGASILLGSRVRAGLNAEWSEFTGSELPGNNGSAYGVGPELRIGLGQGGVLSLGGSYLGGTLEADGTIARTDLTGYSAFCSLAWRTGP